MYESSASRYPLRSMDSMQLRKAILTLRWIGQDDEADRLLLDLAAGRSSEIWPMGPL
jgi:hypothetical protein